MTETEYARKLDEIDRLLNDPGPKSLLRAALQTIYHPTLSTRPRGQTSSWGIPPTRENVIRD
jgi:hypothetical protein